MSALIDGSNERRASCSSASASNTRARAQDGDERHQHAGNGGGADRGGARRQRRAAAAAVAAPAPAPAGAVVVVVRGPTAGTIDCARSSRGGRRTRSNRVEFRPVSAARVEFATRLFLRVTDDGEAIEASVFPGDTLAESSGALSCRPDTIARCDQRSSLPAGVGGPFELPLRLRRAGLVWVDQGMELNGYILLMQRRIDTEHQLTREVGRLLGQARSVRRDQPGHATRVRPPLCWSAGRDAASRDRGAQAVVDGGSRHARP